MPADAHDHADGYHEPRRGRFHQRYHPYQRYQWSMIKEEYKYSEITEKIIGCAMKVHRTLGNGFQEVIYQRALAIELGKAGIEFAREVEMAIHYDGQEIGTRRADFLIIPSFSSAVSLRLRRPPQPIHHRLANTEFRNTFNNNDVD